MYAVGKVYLQHLFRTVTVMEYRFLKRSFFGRAFTFHAQRSKTKRGKGDDHFCYPEMIFGWGGWSQCHLFMYDAFSLYYFFADESAMIVVSFQSSFYGSKVRQDRANKMSITLPYRSLNAQRKK